MPLLGEQLMDFSSTLEITDCDQLRNVNSYDYLYQVVLKTFPENEAIVGGPTCFSFLREFKEKEVYESKFPYGDLYTRFFYALEQDIENKAVVWPALKKTLLLEAVFVNRNRALERAALLTNLSPPTSPVNSITPENMDSASQKIRTMAPGMIANSLFGGWAVSKTLSYLGATQAFKPMFGTSMLSVKNYRYQQELDDRCPIELRSGTQAQYIEDGTARLNPIFEAWLVSQYEKNREMTCVYFNSLGRDSLVSKDYLDVVVGVSTRQEREYERNLTLQLHAAEDRHPNLIVITLPADKGLLSASDYLLSDPFVSVEKVAYQIFAIASGNDLAEIPVKDFYISSAAEKKLYRTEEEKTVVLKGLIANSLQKILNLSIDQDAEKIITQAQYQAVYFHFIKYELTHFILEKFALKMLIFACKDGIDRAGIASLYYNLMRSLAVSVPFTEEEFHRALDAAPKYVKGRPMNHHRTILWNVIHHLLTANIVEVPQWLQNWHDANIPVKLRESKVQMAM